MKKRTPQWPAWALAALPTLALGGCSERPATAEQPNIIFIYADDLGIGDLSCYGATAVETPALDALAAAGQRFTNAYSTSATSTPSRFGMLTGLYPWRQQNTGIAPGNSELIIDPDCHTLADVMHEAGYATAVVGKWHLGLGPRGGTDFNAEIRPGPRDLGFDYEFIIPATVDRVPCVYVEQGHVVGLDPADPIQVSYTEKVGDYPTYDEHPELARLQPSQGHNQTIINGIPRIGYMAGGHAALWVDEAIADTITSKACRFIREHSDRPFFLYMGTQDVHVPRIPHPRFSGKSGMGDRGDVILQLDWTIGEVVRTLEELGLKENTLLIFTSDNGPVIDDGYADRAAELLGDHRPMGEYRGGKYSLYEAGTRIPFIVHWPARVAAGVQPALFSQIDLYASLATLVGGVIPEGAAPDSQNHLAALLGESKEGREELVQQNLNNTLSLICNGWKYLSASPHPAIEYWTRTELGNSPEPQLYDLRSDPGERHNLAAEHPDQVADMALRLDAIRQSVASTSR